MEPVVDALRACFERGQTRSYSWRMQQLGALARLLEQEEPALLEALRLDLGRSRLDGWMAELHEVHKEVQLARRQLRSWQRPVKVPTPLVLQPGTSFVQPEPLGVCLIIAPWNYPVLLLLGPLVGALAAGNAVLLKPSEIAAHTSALLARLIPRYLDPDAVRVVEGGVPETSALLAQRFDHIFYTGNGTVGRIVMQAAARHLTPVTLELGGKSPCLIDADCDVAVAARRVAWGKFMNCGQTCVAPDYVLVHERVHDAFLERLVHSIRAFYGEHPERSADYGRIIDARHHQRLLGLLAGSGELVVGGQSDAASRYLAPSVLRDVPDGAPVMREEIFGPILPVLKVASLDQAIDFVRARDKPLALYLFSNDAQSVQRVLGETSSGGVVINHTLLHLAVPGLPFGGVGASGMGAYHGKHGFDTFSHRKAVLRKGVTPDPSFAYPPHGERKAQWLRRLL
jgi:aldehyde dehydrogenase (NAD+)